MADIQEESVLETRIRIEGYYYFYLFRNDSFKGKIIIDGFDQTMNKEVDFEIQQGLSILVYREWVNSKLFSEVMGYIATDIGMRHIMILFNDENYTIDFSTDHNSFLISPGTDRTNMLKRYEELKKKLLN